MDEWRYLELDADGNLIQSPATRPAPSQDIDWHAALETRTREGYQAGLERGLREGRAAEREAQAAAQASALGRLASSLDRIAADFAAERRRFFELAEQEVVRLALAIASRILRREARGDPLLLLGSVRVALGQLCASTAVRLRVPRDDADLWEGAVALLPSRDVTIEVIADEKLRLGECLLESDLGSADLGIAAQLGEVERVFAHGALPDERREQSHDRPA